jgi:hypothetical protein
VRVAAAGKIVGKSQTDEPAGEKLTAAAVDPAGLTDYGIGDRDIPEASRLQQPSP